MDKSDVIEAALEAWDKHGWCKGALQSPQGELCTIGALQAGAWGSVEAARKSIGAGAFGAEYRVYSNAAQAVQREIDRDRPARLHSIAFVNDHPDTTEEDMRLYLKRALEPDGQDH